VLILGWHGNPQLLESADNLSFHYHDSAAVLVRDGTIVAAIEEERLNRVKHSSFFPARAIRFCLERAKITIADVDIIVTDTAEEFADFVIARDASKQPHHPFQSGRQLLAATFKREFGVDVSAKLHFCRHHVAHLYSAWHPSGFSEALTVCIDGDGDGVGGSPRPGSGAPGVPLRLRA